MGGKVLGVLCGAVLLVSSTWTPAGARTAPDRFAVREILGSSAGPCASDQLPGTGELEGTCFTLGATSATSNDVRSIDVREIDPGAWGVNVDLTKNAERAMSRFLEQHFGEQVALVASGQVTATPTIQQPDFSGDITVTSDLTKRDARALARVIRPGGPIRVHGFSADDITRSAAVARAERVCESYRPNVGPAALVMLAMGQTAGQIVDAARLTGRDAFGWEAFPPDHFVATCSFDVQGTQFEDRVVDCSSPTQPRVLIVKQLFIDESGRATDTFDSIPPQKLCE